MCFSLLKKDNVVCAALKLIIVLQWAETDWSNMLLSVICCRKFCRLFDWLIDWCPTFTNDMIYRFAAMKDRDLHLIYKKWTFEVPIWKRESNFKINIMYDRPVDVSILYKYRLPHFNMPAAPLLLMTEIRKISYRPTIADDRVKKSSFSRKYDQLSTKSLVGQDDWTPGAQVLNDVQ